MTRYRHRGNLNWLWQQRDSRGRFLKTRSDKASEEDPKWFTQMPLWKKMLTLLLISAIAIALYYWLPGLFVLLAIWGLIITFYQ